ncbi:MAG: MFS transporter [Chloroflexi bacterium]|nr:MFS transporter [Chloroflexota bacterium]
MNMRSQAAGRAPAKKRALGLIFFIMLMDIIGLTIIIPVAPFIVQRYSNDAFAVTALTGIYAAAQFIAAPALGKISDRTGRRPVLLVCILGSAFGYFLFGVGGALWILLLSRAIDGVTGGNLSTASAYLADVSTPEERPRNFALLGMAFGLGFILGPALGGAVSQISVDAPAFTAGSLALVSAALIFFMLPESLPKERRETAPLRPSDFNPFVSIGEMMRKPGLGLLLVVTCLFAFAFNGANSTMALFMAQKFATQPWQIGVLFVVGGLVTAITQAVLVPRVVARFGEKTMAIASLAGLGLGELLVSLAPQFWMLFPITLLLNGVGGFFWATMGSLTVGKVDPREQGILAGVNTALQSLMSVIGPLAAGAVYDHVMPGAPFWMGAMVFVVAALLAAGTRTATVRAQAMAASK